MKKKLKMFSAVISVTSLSLASLGMGFYGSNWWVTLNREFASFDRNEEANLGTAELNNAMEWLKDESDQSDIFASNNDSFLLSALSHRRGFLQSKYLLRRHTVFTDEWEAELDHRGELLVQLFLDPIEIKLKQIADRGVRWLIVEKSKIAPEDLLFFRESNFENNEYLILSLKFLKV